MQVCHCEGDREATDFPNWCENCRTFAIEAYDDGYSCGLEPSWPSPDHLGSEAFEYGWLDGRHKKLGSDHHPDRGRISDRLTWYHRIMSQT